MKRIICLHKNKHLTFRGCGHGGLFNLHYDIYEVYKCEDCGKYIRKRAR